MERCDRSSVGYAIRMESQRSAETRLLFCTTGVLLRMLEAGDAEGGSGHVQVGGGMPPCSHVIIDEVHERSLCLRVGSAREREAVIRYC